MPILCPSDIPHIIKSMNKLKVVQFKVPFMVHKVHGRQQVKKRRGPGQVFFSHWPPLKNSFSSDLAHFKIIIHPFAINFNIRITKKYSHLLQYNIHQFPFQNFRIIYITVFVTHDSAWLSQMIPLHLSFSYNTLR